MYKIHVVNFIAFLLLLATTINGQVRERLTNEAINIESEYFGGNRSYLSFNNLLQEDGSSTLFQTFISKPIQAKGDLAFGIIKGTEYTTDGIVMDLRISPSLSLYGPSQTFSHNSIGGSNLNYRPAAEYKTNGIVLNGFPLRQLENGPFAYYPRYYDARIYILRDESNANGENFSNAEASLVIENRMGGTTAFDGGEGEFNSFIKGNINLTTTQGDISLDPTLGNIILNGTTYNSSDKKLKKNIKSLKKTIDRVMTLKPKKYILKKSGNIDYGFIAQDLQKVYPELVSTIDNNETLGINYTALISVLTKAIQDQQDTIKKQEAEIENIKKHLRLESAN